MEDFDSSDEGGGGYIRLEAFQCVLRWLISSHLQFQNGIEKSSFRIAFMKASSCSLAMSGFGSYAVACRTRTDFLLM
ncbi:MULTISPECIES: hypothetical protein [Bacteroidaceae]|uniref:Uncharacterized protein n=4 Tax=Bacteroidales TaxID=171549 RepID=A0A015XAU5_BACFG|nr:MULTISPECIES: hypothetical protein [Bacteroides]EXZ31185.1 hypothetical protein M136_5070 [Bacteroides fragilis str. S36L11]EYA88106.1 hypothetical protein M137_0102 [Bacteroides fragilis str. S36L12]EYA93246.1 hypothetical protein M135_0089 [Bacteroides fragilis str. S36L5]MBP7485833.1 hypothetical protein [Parabacteroides sp.]MBV4242118.1 hypothetical protein [Phocaeicola dorei]MCE8871512.1 hypothetical protein [Bacteroides fragilis]MCQ5372013.1 hypothetical protein [Phocaeicola vulgatu